MREYKDKLNSELEKHIRGFIDKKAESQQVEHANKAQILLNVLTSLENLESIELQNLATRMQLADYDKQQR